MGKCHSRLAGFTLLELSVVMFIMAVLLGVAIPQFSNFLESDLEKETKKIATLIEELRLQAILKSESYKLIFDTKDSEYQIFTIDPTDSSKNLPNELYAKPIKLTAPVEISDIELDTEDEITSRFGFDKDRFKVDKIFGQQYEFRIDSSGFIDLFTIRLKDKNDSITLRVKSIMGEISIGPETPL